MGQARQRGTFEQRQADALIKLAAERAYQQKLREDRAKEKAVMDADERVRIADLPEKQRQIYNRRGKSLAHMELIVILALGAVNGLK